ncbi:MAG: phosphoribosylamine--glycine ligase [Spirochaetia bacterium]
MRVLIIGSGAREHALAWKFSISKRICGLYIAPGNAGTDELGENLPDLDINDHEQVIQICKVHKIEAVFIGPEAPLAAGLADQLETAGIPTIGPKQESAKLEASKAFSKKFMKKHRIPTAESKEFSDPKKFEKYVSNTDSRIVVKKSGLAAGKGVLESDNIDEIISFGKDVLKDDTLIVEEFLEGFEVSIFALCDGKNYIVLPPCSDFKKAHEGDTGPNTGGMGSICPVPWVSSSLLEEIESTIVEPTFKGLKKEGLLYKGVVYIGLMITPDGPKVLEYNVRFGDPESQVLLPVIKSDFGNLTDAIINEKLDTFPLELQDYSSIGVVVASEGYPGEYEKGKAVAPMPSFPERDAVIFHASTTRDENGTVKTRGGRCFTAVGFGKNLLSASIRAYEAASKIQFDGAWYRNDIGKKFFME